MIRFTCGPLVRFLRTTAGAIGARLSLRPSFSGRVKTDANLGRIAPRERGLCRASHLSVVIVRLDRTTQYSRDADDGIDRPQRTGSPACAGDDGLGVGRVENATCHAVNPTVTSFLYTLPTISRRGSRAYRRASAYHVAFEDPGLGRSVAVCRRVRARRFPARRAALHRDRRRLGPDRLAALAGAVPCQLHPRSLARHRAGASSPTMPRPPISPCSTISTARKPRAARSTPRPVSWRFPPPHRHPSP